MDAKSRSSIVEVVRNPLGFFALSLLIVEGFLGITLIFSDGLDSRAKWCGMVIGTVLFALVVILVFVLVWKKPENLIYGGDEYMESKKIDADTNTVAVDNGGIPF